MIPKVSICVPNLNMLPFLPERFESILCQSHTDFELFVFDSHSDDGAWEFIQRLASRDKRMRLMQGPREGPYPAWNQCVAHTTGEFVYIATSDDTMADDCIEKLLRALERNEHCDLAHCPLRVIDAANVPIVPSRWPSTTVFASDLPELINLRHIRKAPYDGLLHLTGRHVYLSVTQLLIRRTLFRKIGPFPNKWGNISDFNWEMRAGLVADTVHVPDTWASWRLHARQATNFDDLQSPERLKNLEEMIADAIRHSSPFLDPEVLDCPWTRVTHNLRTYYADLGSRRSKMDRRLFQLGQLLVGEPEVRAEVINAFSRERKWPRRAPHRIRLWLEKKGLGPAINYET